MGGQVSCVGGDDRKDEKIEMLEASVRDLIVLLRRSESREEMNRRTYRYYGQREEPPLPSLPQGRMQSYRMGGAKLGVVRECQDE